MYSLLAAVSTPGGGRVVSTRLDKGDSRREISTAFAPTFLADGALKVICGERDGRGVIAWLDPAGLELASIARLRYSPAQVSVSDSLLAVAHYQASRISIHDTSGVVRTQYVAFHGSGPHPRQDRSHPHSTLFSKGRLLVADHGADAIHVLVEDERNDWRHVTSWRAPAGSGPRDLLWFKGRVWLTTELDASLHQLGLDGDALVETAAPLLVGNLPAGNNLLAGLVADCEGRRIYVGNRIENVISVINVDAEPKVALRIPVSGWPRHLALSPDHRYVAAALENANSVQVIATDGESVVASIDTGGSPQAVLFCTEREEQKGNDGRNSICA